MPRIPKPLPFSIASAAAKATRPHPARITTHHRRPTHAALPHASPQVARHPAPPHPLPRYSATQRRAFSVPRAYSKMASDEDYMAFLDKANKDADDARAGAAATTTTKLGPFVAMDEGVEVPRVIGDVIGEMFYVSDADEPFEGVSLRWEGGQGLPDEEEFATLIRHWDPAHADVEIMDPTDWDPRGQYARIVDAVCEATRGNDVRVYRIVRDPSRVEYFVVSRDDEGGRIVGVKALGVES